MVDIPDAAVQAAAKCYAERVVSINDTFSSLAREMLTAAFPHLQTVDVAAVRRQAFEEAATLIDEGFEKAVGKSWRNDGKPSKNDSCPHDKFMYEDCESCAAAAIRALSDDPALKVPQHNNN